MRGLLVGGLLVAALAQGAAARDLWDEIDYTRELDPKGRETHWYRPGRRYTERDAPEPGPRAPHSRLIGAGFRPGEPVPRKVLRRFDDPPEDVLLRCPLDGDLKDPLVPAWVPRDRPQWHMPPRPRRPENERGVIELVRPVESRR